MPSVAENDLDVVFAKLISGEMTPDQAKVYLQNTGRHSEMHIKFYLESYAKLQGLRRNPESFPGERRNLMMQYLIQNPEFIELNRIARKKQLN